MASAFTKAYCVMRALLDMAKVGMCYTELRQATALAVPRSKIRSEEITYFMTFPVVVGGREHAIIIPKRSVAFGGWFFIDLPSLPSPWSTLLNRGSKRDRFLTETYFLGAER